MDHRFLAETPILKQPHIEAIDGFKRYQQRYQHSFWKSTLSCYNSTPEQIGNQNKSGQSSQQNSNRYPELCQLGLASARRKEDAFSREL